MHPAADTCGKVCRGVILLQPAGLCSPESASTTRPLDGPYEDWLGHWKEDSADWLGHWHHTVFVQTGTTRCSYKPASATLASCPSWCPDWCLDLEARCVLFQSARLGSDNPPRSIDSIVSLTRGLMRAYSTSRLIQTFTTYQSWGLKSITSTDSSDVLLSTLSILTRCENVIITMIWDSPFN
jgi:hypothetical protein